MTRAIVHIVGPVIVWALHFIAIYALISAACAPRGLIGIDVMRASAGLVTFLASISVLAWWFGAGRRLRHARDPNTDITLETAAWWSALIAFLAIFANLWPVAWLAGCAG